jgi:hypothetical protein
VHWHKQDLYYSLLWEQPVKKLQRVRTRRQLVRATAVSAASIPFLALTIKSVRSLISEIVDVRDRTQIAYDELAQRAEAMLV